MIDSIKVSEVTDVVTPAEETYPENYNFSMESTWEEQTFSAGGEGGITPTGTKTINITQNGVSTHNVKTYESAQINTNVPNPSTGTKQISQNGTYDVTDYASAQVNVPNSYSASDEGKVVSNGALTAQTSRQVTANGTYDTTLNSSVEVNVPASGITPTGTKNITTNGDHDVTAFATAHVDVPTGITPSGSQTFTENGTYDVTNLAEAVVNVESGGGGNAEYYTGTISFNDTEATSITFPVGIGSSDEFLFEFQLVRTGEVADGEVTYDDVLYPNAPNPRWHNVEVVCGAWAKRRSTAIIVTSGNKPLFGVYNYLSYSSCGSNGGTGITNENATTVLALTDNSITFTPTNTAKKFGATGVYFEYKYHIFVARNAL